MLTEIDLLNHIYQTAEMGQEGILSVLRHTDDPKLTLALNRQMCEYQQLQRSAQEMLLARGMEPQGIGAFAKLSSETMSAAKTMMDHSATKLAEMMIQGSTMGVTKVLRTLRDCDMEDERVLDLADQLLKTQQSNIDEMKQFL